MIDRFAAFFRESWRRRYRAGSRAATRHVGLARVLGACLGCFLTTHGSAQPPNIVVFLADDMGLGDTSAYQDWTGNADQVQLHTPAMDELARRGVRFSDAHSPHSRCTTSRYALLAGRYCWRTRLKHWVLFGVQGDPLLDRPRITMPEFLQSFGYRTGMVGKWHLGLTYQRSDGGPADGWADADLTRPVFDGPLDHGFNFFYGMSRSHGTSGPNGDQKNTSDQTIGPGWIEGREVVGATGNGKELDGSYQHSEVGTVLDREAFHFLHEAAAGPQPWFLYFASPANHTPYTPSDRLGDEAVLRASRFVDGRPTNSRRHDFIYQNDVHIARLTEWLRTTEDVRRPGRALLENTLFIFSSDNGADRPAKVFTGPLRSNKGSVYEGGHRIPFIASWPAGQIGDGDAATPGQTCDRVLGLNDLYATFAEILEQPLPPAEGEQRGAEDSSSQLTALRGQTAAPRGALFSNDHKEASQSLADQRAWVTVRSSAAPLPGDWKLLLDHRFAFQAEVHPQELYNLADDPLEEHNLIGEARAAPALDFLIQWAHASAGDDGYSRR